MNCLFLQELNKAENALLEQGRFTHLVQRGLKGKTKKERNNSMSWGIFIDKNYKPTIEDTYNTLSISKPLFVYLVNYIESNFKTHYELKFYGKNYGWALRFNKSGK